MEHCVVAGEFCFGSGFKYVHYSANSSVILGIFTDYKEKKTVLHNTYYMKQYQHKYLYILPEEHCEELHTSVEKAEGGH